MHLAILAERVYGQTPECHQSVTRLIFSRDNIDESVSSERWWNHEWMLEAEWVVGGTGAELVPSDT